MPLPPFASYVTLIHYGRYSSPKQAKGVSEQRQIDKADAWAAANNVTFTDRLLDQGLSGYSGRHRTEGSFGTLLQQAKDGAITTPALLVLVEGDRAGREDVDVQLESLVLGLLRSGVDLLVVDSNLHLNLERWRSDLGAQIQLQAILHGANQYSRRISERLLDAHERGRQKMLKGQPVRLGWAPHWLEWNGTAWCFNGREQTIIRLLDLAHQHGSAIVAQTLNAEGHHTAKGRSWTPGTVEHVISSPAVAGGRPAKRRDADQIAWGYFPELISRERWEALKLRRRRRDPKSGAGGDQRSMIYIGQGITTCVCGGAAGQRMVSFVDRNGDKQQRRYVRCRRCKTGQCDHPAVRLDELTAHLLTRLKRSDLALLFPQQQDSQAAALRSTINGLRQQLEQHQAMAAAAEQQIARLLASDPESVPIVARQVRIAEQQAKATETELRAAQGELQQLQSSDGEQLCQELQDRVKALLGVFADGADTADDRRGLNQLLRRLDLAVTIDGKGQRIGLRVADGEIDWQPLLPGLDLAGLKAGMVETVNVSFDVDDETLELLQRLPRTESGYLELGEALKGTLDADGESLVDA